MLKWGLIYAAGVIVTAWLQDKFCGASGVEHTEDEQRLLGIGRTFTIIVWPLCLPIILLLWLQNYAEDAAYRRRFEQWQKGDGEK